MHYKSLAAVCSIAVLLGCSEDPILPPEPTEFDTLNEEFLYRAPRLLEAFDVPGVAVGLIVDGEVVLRRGFGVANTQTGKEVTANTVFNVGEISTLFASWGAIRLVNETLLFDDLPIERQISTWQFPESGFDSEEVTIDRLLRHTGGTSLETYAGWPNGTQLPSLVASLNGETNGSGDVRLVYEPETDTRYSGGGFTVLQLAMTEAVSFSESFENFMLFSVLRPFGMTSSDFRYAPGISSNLATAYLADGQPQPVRRFTALAAMGLMTTLTDMIAYADLMISVAQGQPFNLFGGFSRSTMENMSDQATGQSPAYSRGHEIRRVGSLVTMGHTGSIIGSHSTIQVDPFRQHALIIMTNGENGKEITRVLTCRWYEELSGASPVEFCAQP